MRGQIYELDGKRIFTFGGASGSAQSLEKSGGNTVNLQDYFFRKASIIISLQSIDVVGSLSIFTFASCNSLFFRLFLADCILS